MRYVNKGNHSELKIIDRAALLQILGDTDRMFSKDELTDIISDQFFNDATPLDAELVDAALARMLLVDGIKLDETAIQRERERMIYGVLKRILKSPT
jgi:hypothetical protein